MPISSTYGMDTAVFDITSESKKGSSIGKSHSLSLPTIPTPTKRHKGVSSVTTADWIHGVSYQPNGSGQTGIVRSLQGHHKDVV